MCVLHTSGIPRATCAVPGSEVEFAACLFSIRCGILFLSDQTFTSKHFRAVP
jgi:hypothetical protein